MRKHVGMVVCTLLPLVACANKTHVGAYKIRLAEVERPSLSEERFSARDVRSQAGAEAISYSYEDELIAIRWQPTATGLAFELRNKTEHSMKLSWDEAAYVDENGSSHRVMHTGVPYAQRSSPQAPSVIVQGGNLSDFIFPTSNVFFTLDSWDTRAILPHRGDETLMEAGSRLVGNTLQVLLPIEVQGTVNEYLFRFGVDGFCAGSTARDTRTGTWGEPEVVRCWGDSNGIRLSPPA